MVIKPEAGRYFEAYPDEKKLAHKFDEAFDITFREKLSNFPFWFAQPKKHIEERFGLQKEVLIIYAPAELTVIDARVFTTIENITRRPEFKSRLEKVLVFLVHKANITTTKEFLNRGTELDRIIVPIHADELLDPKKGDLFLSSRIAQAFGEFDLFGMSSPITSDNYFFGRNDLVQGLVNRFTIHHQNSGLFGLRKTGKTSVLRATERRMRDRPVLMDYIDCSNPGVHGARWWEVLNQIAKRLETNFNKSHRPSIEIEKEYSPTIAGLEFSSAIKKLLKFDDLDQIILMLDEIEYITPELSGTVGRHWDQDFIPFWQTIRSVHQETEGKFSFIVSGVNPHCVERSHFGTVPNPIFQIATPLYLEAFSVSGIRDMVRSIGRYAGLRFEENVYSYLEETYGGHPFLIRIACSEVWSVSEKNNVTSRITIKTKNFIDAQINIKSRMSQPIKDILLSLVWWYREEYDLLQILANGDEKFVSEYLQDDPKSMLQFAKYGILRKNSPEEFAIAIVKEFLKESGETYKSEISLFFRGDIPPEYLPKVPDINVLAELFIKRSDIEIKLRKAIMLYLGIKFNWDKGKIANNIASHLQERSGRGKPRDLFVGRSPNEVIEDLYTVDLKDIISKNWDIFSPLFDSNKARFEMNMDTLNSARKVDAHTKSFTDEEKTDFENSYAWLLNRLSKLPT